MAIAKVQYKSSPEATPEVWMDTTQKTVTAANLSSGETALKNDGTDIVGTLVPLTTRTGTFDVSSTTTTHDANDFGTYIVDVPVSSRTASSTSWKSILLAYGSDTPVVLGDNYTVTGTIKAIDSNNNTLATYTINAAIKLASSGAASLIYTGSTNDYILRAGLEKQTNFYISVTYGQTATYGLSISLTLTSSNKAFSQVTINKGYTEQLMKNYISRSSDFTDIEWPDGITSIGINAFANCSFFNPSSLPSGITSIRSYAFSSCSHLTLTSLPSSLTNIGAYAFYQCTALALTSLPSEVRSIGASAFYQCNALALTSLPSSITVIESDTFYNCQQLALTSLPSGVTTINSSAFQGCTALALTSLPSGLTTISSNVFYNCTNLALTSLPNGVTSIPQYAFYGCTNLALTSLPSGITSIATYAFARCTNLTTISCDGSITTLGSYAFTGTSTYPMSLTSVSFPNMAISSLGTTFGSTTAENACQQLAFIDIGNIQGILTNAFANCYALQTLVLRRTGSICSLNNINAFTNTPMSGYNSLTGTVYVPSALISSYQTATNWSTLYNNGTVTFSAIEGSAYEL